MGRTKAQAKTNAQKKVAMALAEKPLLKRREVLKEMVRVREAGIGSQMTNYHCLRKVKMRKK